MGYIVLNPNSHTNPSAMYRVVKYADWIKYVNKTVRSLNIQHEATTYEAARTKANELNNGK